MNNGTQYFSNRNSYDLNRRGVGILKQLVAELHDIMYDLSVQDNARYTAILAKLGSVDEYGDAETIRELLGAERYALWLDDPYFDNEERFLFRIQATIYSLTERFDPLVLREARDA